MPNSGQRSDRNAAVSGVRHNVSHVKKRASALVVGCAVVAVVYAALGVVAYSLGPVPQTCRILGRGSAQTAHGDSSMFFVLAASSPPAGLVQFTDEGPMSHVQLHDPRVSTVTCTTSSTFATVTGSAHPQPGVSPIVGFRINLAVAAGKSTPATFRLRLTDGYDSGIETLPRGSLEIQTVR
jgi:hypothetical protein